MEQRGHIGEPCDEKLTLEELGQLTRDLVLGHQTSVALDNPTKLKAFESLQRDIERAKAQGYMIETPE